MRKLVIAVAVGLLGMGTVAIAGTKDGEPPLPKDYKTWPTMLRNVQRPDVSQVRDLYINQVGKATRAGKPFPVGTVMVMENHKGVKAPNGELIRAGIGKIFVMTKVKGKVDGVDKALANGQWVYSAYGADGNALSEDFNACRGCHLPDASKDFVKRYDEYFEKRAAK
jgi:hemoglobin